MKYTAYFNDVQNNHTNSIDLTNPTMCYDTKSEGCPYSNQRLCSLSCPDCIWCVSQSEEGKCVPLKDFTQENCPNSYKTETFQNNNKLNTIISISITIMIILFLCLIYNGKHR